VGGGDGCAWGGLMAVSFFFLFNEAKAASLRASKSSCNKFYTIIFTVYIYISQAQVTDKN
jgi:hypothetical protein